MKKIKNLLIVSVCVAWVVVLSAPAFATSIRWHVTFSNDTGEEAFDLHITYGGDPPDVWDLPGFKPQNWDVSETGNEQHFTFQHEGSGVPDGSGMSIVFEDQPNITSAYWTPNEESLDINDISVLRVVPESGSSLAFAAWGVVALCVPGFVRRRHRSPKDDSV